MLTPGMVGDIFRRRPDLILVPPALRICGIAVNGAGADIERFRADIARAREIWGPCRIFFEQGSFTTIDADLDYPNWVDFRAAPAALLAQRGGCGPRDIRVYYVRSIAGSRFQGRSGFTTGEPGWVALSASAHPNLFPHELGHLFLGGNEEHRDGPSQADRVNIMRSDVGSIQGPPQVDLNQCTRAGARVREILGLGSGALLRQVLASGAGARSGALAAQLTAIMATHPSPVARAMAATALESLGMGPR